MAKRKQSVYESMLIDAIVHFAGTRCRRFVLVYENRMNFLKE